MGAMTTTNYTPRSSLALCTPSNGGEISQQAQVTEDLYHSFIDYLDRAEKTIQTYTGNLKHFFEWLSVNNITQPTMMDIKAYKAELISSGLKANTRYAYIFVVRRFFTWTEAMGIYPNIAGKIQGAKIDREAKHKNRLSDTQVLQLTDSIDTSTIRGLRDYAIIKLILSNGLRDIEIQRANVEDVQEIDGTPYIYLQGKGIEDKTQIMPMHYDTKEAIDRYLEARGTAEPKAPLFISLNHSTHGERLTIRSISRLCKNALINIGIDNERYTAHSLRHTAIDTAYELTGDLYQTSKFARHKQLSTTEIYIHKHDLMKNQCSRLIADYYNNLRLTKEL